MARWELHREGCDPESYDSPAELGSAIAEIIRKGGAFAVIQLRLACIDDDGEERTPTALEQAAIAAAMERESSTVVQGHVRSPRERH